ncbi:hypothetical protein EIK76_01200 [Rheinheimera mesophila]|uniref:Phage tail protein n=1 Tax=Rheinheimera mesophila TaxID=1547515 RepID=A0A3P3QNC6_9GAMM|nr:putative phage tail assembly chaperone [Rheinheimera mesophila]KKK99852.1 hypothetical protein SD53_17835 [Rheinheimera mesophila]RRJ22731.1 hypothetical protein EIK76_01200 [Rheinheimera mesophila]
MKQVITLGIGTTDFAFNVTAQDHNDFVDAAARGGSMTAAAKNFVVRVIDPAQKEDFKKLLDSSPGAELQIAGALKEEFSPVLEITVKK